MARLLLGVLALALAVTAGSLAAFASSNGGKVNDVAATRAYLLARHKFLVATERDQPIGEQAVRSLVAKVKSECANVLVGAPTNKEVAEVKEEISNEVPLTLYQPERKATIAFARTVQHLRWTNRKLTYYVRASASEEAAKSRLKPPDICADAQALAESKFHSVSSSTARFNRQYEAANSITTVETRVGESPNVDQQIMRMLKPYERPGERGLIPPKPTKHQRERGEAVLIKAVFQPIAEIERALGLPK